MSDILQKLKQGTEVYKDVEVPGTDGLMVRVKMVSEDDELKAGLAADNIYKDIQVGSENFRVYDAEVETQTLYRSLKDLEGKAIANNITDFRQALTSETQEFFAQQLDELKEEYSPNIDRMDDEKFDKLMFDLKKKPEETIGSVSNIGLAKRLILSLVNQQKN